MLICRPATTACMASLQPLSPTHPPHGHTRLLRAAVSSCECGLLRPSPCQAPGTQLGSSYTLSLFPSPSPLHGHESLLHFTDEEQRLKKSMLVVMKSNRLHPQTTADQTNPLQRGLRWLPTAYPCRGHGPPRPPFVLGSHATSSIGHLPLGPVHLRPTSTRSVTPHFGDFPKPRAPLLASVI